MKKQFYFLRLIPVLFLCALMLPSSAHSGAVNLDGLVGYWPMDEGSGTIAADMSIFGNDGVLNGNPEWIVGKVGSALDLD